MCVQHEHRSKEVGEDCKVLLTGRDRVLLVDITRVASKSGICTAALSRHEHFMAVMAEL